MAYDFGATHVNRLTLPTSVLTYTDPRPITVGFRIKQATTAVRTGGLSQWIYENDGSAGDPRLGVAIQGGATNALSLYIAAAYKTSSTWTATTAWHSLALSAAAGTNGAVAFYRNGSAIGTTTASIGTSSSSPWASIGALANGAVPAQATDSFYTTGFNIDGSLGEFVIWNVVLDAAEAIAFTAGASGLLIRPSAIRCYMPFNNGVTQDLYRGAVWVQQGANTKQADHPLVILPTGPMTGNWIAPAAAATTSMPPYMIPPPAIMHYLVR